MRRALGLLTARIEPLAKRLPRGLRLNSRLITAVSIALVIGVTTVEAGAANATSAKAASKGPITVVTLSDLTGPTKALGQEQWWGIQGAAAYFNAHGGIGGHKVVLKHLNDNGDPTTAVSVLLQYLSSNPAPTMITAGTEAGDQAALIPVLAKRNVFAMSQTDGSLQCKTKAQVSCPNQWTLTDPSIDNALTVANFFKSRGVKKVGILEEQIDFTESETPATIQALNKDGIAHNVVAFPGTALDLTPQINQLKAAGDTAVYAEALLSPVGAAIKDRAQLGWKAPMMFDLAGSTENLTQLAPNADLKGIYEDLLYPMDPKHLDNGIKLMIRYSKRYGGKALSSNPLDQVSNGWDQIVALNAAIKKDGGNLTTKALDAAMLKLPHTDSLRTFQRALCYSRTDHENVCGSPADYSVAPAGPLSNGQVQPLK